ncbi:EF-hand domain - like 4 [Theobroma cacao]|nr:EF-hand domain - like 4 [Theobroma cacao]
MDEFKAWLRHFDADNDGRINQEELKEALHSLRVWFGWWKARQAMKEADSNHDGQIENGKEIEKLVNYAQQRLHMKIYQSDCGIELYNFLNILIPQADLRFPSSGKRTDIQPKPGLEGKPKSCEGWSDNYKGLEADVGTEDFIILEENGSI